jgi:DNA primase
MEIQEYGPERLSAGPAIGDSGEIIVVEGRADVLNLLKNGFKNVIAMNGTSVPDTIKELSKKKSIVVFVDGDRGGNLIIRELLSVADIDFVCRAPDGKEVEELTKKEIHKALRGRITAEQTRLDLKIDAEGQLKQPEQRPRRSIQQSGRRGGGGSSHHRGQNSPPQTYSRPTATLSPDAKQTLKSMLEDLFGTRGACIFDEKLSVLGKVPLTELDATLKSVNQGIYAVVLDGTIDQDLVKLAERLGIKYLLGSESKVKESGRVTVLKESDL